MSWCGINIEEISAVESLAITLFSSSSAAHSEPYFSLLSPRLPFKLSLSVSPRLPFKLSLSLSLSLCFSLYIYIGIHRVLMGESPRGELTTFRISPAAMTGPISWFNDGGFMEKRQLFLRSYHFSRKRSFAGRIGDGIRRFRRLVWVKLRAVRRLFCPHLRRVFSRGRRRRRFLRLHSSPSGSSLWAGLNQWCP